jgi:cytochrome c oxidase subunit 4
MATDPHAHAGGHDHHGPTSTQPYLVVFAALCAFTLVSFVVNYFVRDAKLAAGTGFVLILGVAVIKALMVVIYFMHLKWDWGRLYFIIIPALVLAPMLVFALLPDLVLYWKNLVQEVPVPR